MTLFSKTVAERTRPGQRQDVEEQGRLALSHRWPCSDKSQTTHSTPTVAQKASAVSSSPITIIQPL